MMNDRRIMERGEPEQVEEEVSLPDGARAFWLSTKVPLRNAAGEVVGSNPHLRAILLFATTVPNEPSPLPV